jgi:xylose isomerase
VLADFVKNRYSSYDSGIGQEIEQGKSTFASLEKHLLEKGNAAANASGRQEMLENMINDYL